MGWHLYKLIMPNAVVEVILGSVFLQVACDCYISNVHNGVNKMAAKYGNYIACVQCWLQPGTPTPPNVDIQESCLLCQTD